MHIFNLKESQKKEEMFTIEPILVPLLSTQVSIILYSYIVQMQILEETAVISLSQDATKLFMGGNYSRKYGTVISRLVRFQLVRSPVQCGFKTALNSANPRFSAVFAWKIFKKMLILKRFYFFPIFFQTIFKHFFSKRNFNSFLTVMQYNMRHWTCIQVQVH